MLRLLLQGLEILLNEKNENHRFTDGFHLLTIQNYLFKLLKSVLTFVEEMPSVRGKYVTSHCEPR